jgi:hypothetical protein
VEIIEPDQQSQHQQAVYKHEVVFLVQAVNRFDRFRFFYPFFDIQRLLV